MDYAKIQVEELAGEPSFRFRCRKQGGELRLQIAKTLPYKIVKERGQLKISIGDIELIEEPERSVTRTKDSEIVITASCIQAQTR